MDEESYLKWAERFGVQFGFAFDSDAAMLASWWGLFAMQGLSVADLDGAAAELTTRPPPKDRSHFLQAIPVAARVARRRREDAERRRLDQEYDSGAPLCPTCGSGRGLVTAPHPQCVRDGHWVHPWYESAVPCVCPEGQQTAQRWLARWEAGDIRGERPAFDLARYERRNPRWREQVKAHTAELVERGRRTAEAESADRERGPLDAAGAFGAAMGKARGS